MKILHKLLCTVLLFCAIGMATAQNMTVELRDGQTVKFKTQDIERVTFTDAGTDLEQGPFGIEVTGVTGSSAHLSITPDNSTTRYYFDVCLRADYEEYGVAAIVTEYMKNLMQTYPGLDMQTYLEGTTSVGPDEDDVYNLPDDAEMICYAIAISEQCEPVGTPTVVAFRTLKGGDPKDCTFELAVSGVRSTEATVTVTPSDYTVRYWYGCYAMADWPGDAAIQSMVKMSIDDAVANTGRTLDYIVPRVTFRGAATVDESGFEPSTRYYAYAYAMDAKGNPAGPMFKEVFTTAETDFSDADVSLSYRYFDGNALKEAYPDKFANAGGKVVVQAVVTPNELTDFFAWGLAVGDLTDESAYPQDSAKDALMQGGFKNVSCKNVYANWGVATFLYFGLDKWGIPGKLNRLLVDFDRSGVRPVSEYYDPTESAAGTQMKLGGHRMARPSRIDCRLGEIYRMPSPYRKLF